MATKEKNAGLAQNSGKSAKPTRGRPFAKGDDERRNKGGRPRMSTDVKIAFTALWPHAVDRLKKLIISGDDATALKAVQIALDRALGTVDELGTIKMIESATVETGKTVPILDDDVWMRKETAPDEALQARALEEVERAIEEIRERESSSAAA